jgi:hypothetical protein
LVIELPVLRFTDSDYPLDIFKLFLMKEYIYAWDFALISTNKCSLAVLTDKNVNTTIATTYEINTLISFIIRWSVNTNKKKT